MVPSGWTAASNTRRVDMPGRASAVSRAPEQSRLDEFDAIPAAGLGTIERHIGAIEQIVDVR